jgi:hypothetical protein
MSEIIAAIIGIIFASILVYLGGWFAVIGWGAIIPLTFVLVEQSILEKMEKRHENEE